MGYPVAAAASANGATAGYIASQIPPNVGGYIPAQQPQRGVGYNANGAYYNPNAYQRNNNNNNQLDGWMNGNATNRANTNIDWFEQEN